MPLKKYKFITNERATELRKLSGVEKLRLAGEMSMARLAKIKSRFRQFRPNATEAQYGTMRCRHHHRSTARKIELAGGDTQSIEIYRKLSREFVLQS